MSDQQSLQGIKLHRDILPEDEPSSSTSSSLTRRSKSAPPVRQPNPLPGKLVNLGRTSGRSTQLAPEWHPPFATAQRPLLPSVPVAVASDEQPSEQQQQPLADQTTLIPTEDVLGDIPEQLVAVFPEVPLQFQGAGLRVRVRCYCIGDAFDRLLLQETIIKRSRNSSVRAFSEVLCSSYSRAADGTAGSDIIYFDFGCVVFWGLDKEAETHVLKEIAAPCLRISYATPTWERDRLWILYSQGPKMVIENDTLCLHYSHSDDLDVKLAVSFALAQSTKLSFFEEQMRCLGRDLSFLPRVMAEEGDVKVSEKVILQHCGELYRFVSAVNLLGQILDLPDLIFEMPTHVKSLYKSIFDYMELEDRIHLLNDRFAVISEMLSILRTHVAQSKFAYLETIIIWLVAICSTLAVLQLIAFLGWTPAWRQ